MLKKIAMSCMGGYQIVNGYFTDDGTWVSPYLRGVPNGFEFDNVNFDSARSDYGLDCLDSTNHHPGIDIGNIDPERHGVNTDVDDLIDLG
jgi:hypothetical protein